MRPIDFGRNKIAYNIKDRTSGLPTDIMKDKFNISYANPFFAITDKLVHEVKNLYQERCRMILGEYL
jgi:hypothetical protein